jgi:hypothetical protein
MAKLDDEYVEIFGWDLIIVVLPVSPCCKRNEGGVADGLLAICLFLLVADGWYWLVVKEKYHLLAGGRWPILI